MSTPPDTESLVFASQPQSVQLVYVHGSHDIHRAFKRNRVYRVIRAKSTEKIPTWGAQLTTRGTAAFRCGWIRRHDIGRGVMDALREGKRVELVVIERSEEWGPWRGRFPNYWGTGVWYTVPEARTMHISEKEVVRQILDELTRRESQTQPATCEQDDTHTQIKEETNVEEAKEEPVTDDKIEVASELETSPGFVNPEDEETE